MFSGTWLCFSRSYDCSSQGQPTTLRPEEHPTPCCRELLKKCLLCIFRELWELSGARDTGKRPGVLFRRESRAAPERYRVRPEIRTIPDHCGSTVAPFVLIRRSQPRGPKRHHWPNYKTLERRRRNLRLTKASSSKEAAIF